MSNLNERQFQHNPEAHGQQQLFPAARHVPVQLGTGWTGPPIKPEPVALEKHREWSGARLPSKGVGALQADLTQRTVAGKPAIRFPSDVAEGVRAAGRFKNQFETRTSGGTNNPELRARYEHGAFGYLDRDPAPTTGAKRPVYGYLTEEGNEPSEYAASQYGKLKAVLKPSVRSRMTVTHGDSLSGRVPARAVDVERGRVSAEHTSPSGPRDYIEAQFHGGVTLHDVDHIEVGEGDWRGVTHAEDMDLPWRMRAERRAYQPTLSAKPVHPSFGGDDGGDRHFWSNWAGPQGTTQPKMVINTHQFTQHRSAGFRSAYPDVQHDYPTRGMVPEAQRRS